MSLETSSGPIGVFDSGYGGLTVFREIISRLPDYDYMYLGDNARNPYGPRSFEVVYSYTLQAVEHLFAAGCPLVIIACNTASAKALRTIQQKDLPAIDSSRRVLGVIRPTAEAIGSMTKTRHVGILATQGAVNSQSYIMEIAKLHPDIKVTQESCPMWVPLVENGEFDGDGADYFVKKYIDSLLARDSEIDLIILGCTHYPLLMPKIRAFVPEKIAVLNQGPVVAESLESYLERHPGMESRISRGGSRRYLTTETPEIFEHQGSCFMSRAFKAERIEFTDRTVAEK